MLFFNTHNIQLTVKYQFPIMTKHITLLITFLLVSVLTFGQDRRVTGTVKDNKGSGIPGASVKLKGGKSGIVADKDGKFAITAELNSTLVFSSIGYLPQEQVVDGRSVIDVTLAEDSRQLTDVVVVGYGTRQKKDLTGAVSSVKAANLMQDNPNNVIDQLRGNIPGLNVNINGSPKGGGTGDLLVRGKTTLTANTTPLIVLDGVIYYGQLADINPNDVQSIDVLKDASALAVYGSKAATGVVAITTKKGRSGKPTITLNTNWGFAEVNQEQKVYDGPGFLNWRADVNRSANQNNPYWFYSDPRSLPDSISQTQWLGSNTGDPVEVWLKRLGLTANEITNYKANKTVNWENLVFQKGLRQDHTLSMSARKDETSYYMSINYVDNQDFISGGGYKNVRARVNLDAQATNWLQVGVNMQYAVRNEGFIAADWTQITNNSPYGDYYEADGISPRKIPTDDTGLNALNPFLNNYYNKTMNIQNTLFANGWGKVTLPFGITFQTNFTPGIDGYRTFNSAPAHNPRQNGISTVERDNEFRYSWQVDNLLKWNHTFNKVHNIDLTFLANAEKYQSWWTKAYNENISPSDTLGYHSISSGNKAVVDADDRYYTGDALMGRLNYTYKDRYLFTASVRRDGYSAFGRKFPRATFPALALGWTLTEEEFIKHANLKWLNYAKLRVSYGVNGNRDLRDGNGTVDPYRALALLSTGQYPAYDPVTGTIGATNTVYVSRMQNDNLKWEQTAAYNLGLDFAVLDDRLTGSVDVYTKQTKNLLVSRSLPILSGFQNVISNIGEVDNKGLEVSLNSRNIVVGPVKWSTTATFFLNRNTIKHLYGVSTYTDVKGNTVTGEQNDVGNGWFIGKDIDAIWDYRIQGVWQQNEAATAKQYGAVPGDFKLQKLVNDGPNQYKYTDADKQFLGYKSPRFGWSLRNDFNLFNNFDFSFLLVSNMGQLRDFNQAKNNPGSVGFGRSTSYVYPYWTASNPTNDYARLNSGSSGTSFSVWRKASFVRLATISLGYSLPKSVLNVVHVQAAKFFVNVNNAYYYAPDWHYWDPQYNSVTQGPTPRVYTGGLNVTF